MSLNYGSSFAEAKLTREEVGYSPKEKEARFTLISIFRTIITLIEIGLAFIPGIGAAAEAGIALAGGAINETLDFVSGSANVMNSVFNFATPFIGYGATTKINRLYVSRLNEGVDILGKTTKTLSRAGFRQEEIAEQLIGAGIISSEEELNNVETIADLIKNTTISKKQASNYGINYFAKPEISSLTRKETINSLHIIKTQRKRLEAFTESFSENINIQRKILRQIGFTAAEYAPFLKQINSLTISPKEKFSLTLGFIRNFGVLKNNPDRFKVLRTALAKGTIASHEAIELPLAKQLTRLTKTYYPSAKIARASKNTSGVKYLKDFIKALKKPSSREFNDKVVQPIQAIFDANDLGRAPVEAAYRKLKQVISKAFHNKNILKKAATFEEAFEKSGGIVVDSDWILGYKIIKDIPGEKLIQISYGKDTGRIRQVYTFATEKQLLKFIASPGHYYLEHWAYSRGGAKLKIGGLFSQKGFMHGGLANATQSALSFLPAAALRNLFSITSNIVENVWDMSQGDYTKEYLTKLKKSFTSNALNRSVRLTTRVIGGGIASKFLGAQIGNTLGREMQRIGTNILVPIIKTKLNGSDHKAYTSASIINKGLMGIKSNLRRALRHQRGSSSVILQSLAADRKLKIVGRAPNTLAPKRPYRGIKLK